MRADWPLYHLQLTYNPDYIRRIAQKHLSAGDARMTDSTLALLNHITGQAGQDRICTVTHSGFLHPKQDTPLWQFTGDVDISGLAATDDPGLYIRIGRATMNLRRSGRNLRLYASA